MRRRTTSRRKENQEARADSSTRCRVATPLGVFELHAGEGYLNALRFLPGVAAAKTLGCPACAPVRAALRAYFLDARSWPGTALPLRPRGTPFQRRVWKQLLRIPPGCVLSYGDLARLLRSAPRAMGQACRRNPLSILVPCHRIVASRGLGGYHGGSRAPDLERKRWLLRHEGVSSL